MFIYLQMIDTPEQRSRFETMYLLHRQLMYNLAFRILHNQEDAEDAVHQAFVKVAENISKIFDPDCPKTRAFIVTIVENKAIDIYNRRKKYQNVPFEEALVGLTVEYSGENMLAECLSKLPPRYRNILLLKHYHGYTTKEVAGLLDMTLCNAAKLEQRAKAKLEVLCKEFQLL